MAGSHRKSLLEMKEETKRARHWGNNDELVKVNSDQVQQFLYLLVPAYCLKHHLSSVYDEDDDDFRDSEAN